MRVSKQRAPREGQLLFSGRPGAPREVMLPLSDSPFAIRATRFAFEPLGGGKIRLRVTPPNGEALTYERIRTKVTAKP